MRGDSPLGPVCPGAVLFATTTGTVGVTVASDFVGSGGADPIEAAVLLMSPFQSLRSEYLFPVYWITSSFEKFQRTYVSSITLVCDVSNLSALFYLAKGEYRV